MSQHCRRFHDILIPGPADNIALFVSENDVTRSFRLVNRATQRLFRNRVTIHLSRPVHPDAFRRHWLAPGATRALSLAKRKQLLCLVAASGSIPNLEAALEAAAVTPGLELADAAAEAGQLETCQWLRQRGFPFHLYCTCAMAARGGHVHVCDWLVGLCGDEDGRRQILFEAARAAAIVGHVNLMERLLGRCPLALDRFMRLFLLGYVAKGCPLAELRRLHAEWLGQGPQVAVEEERHAIVCASARSRTPDWAAKLEWLEAQGYPRSDRACEEAVRCAAADTVARLQWLRQRGYPMSGLELVVAAGMGKTAALEFLLSDPAVLRELGLAKATRLAAACAARAAKGGHLAALQTLHARGWIATRPALESALKAAVAHGHVFVADWCLGELACAASPLLDGRDEGSSETCDPAASGNVEMLRWLAARGVRWGGRSLAAAAGSGCEEAVEWLLANGCPLPVDGAQPYIRAACNDDLAMMRCLRRCGCSWGPGPLRLPANVRPSPAVLQWLHEEGGATT